MKVPFLVRQIKGRRAVCLGVIAASLVLSVLICGLNAGEARMDREIEAVYRQKTVTCAVPDLTGAQSDSLDLAGWVVRLFFKDEAFPQGEYDAIFQTYITDASAKIRLKGELFEDSIPLVGLADLGADRSFRAEEGVVVNWFSGFGEDVLASKSAVCLLPIELYEQLCPEGESSISLKVVGRYNSSITSEIELEVAGTYLGAESKIVYLPWSYALEQSMAVSGGVYADSVSATIVDNFKIDEFWDVIASRFFVEPDPKGTPVDWDASPVYETYPYALTIYDDGLMQTVEGLRQNQRTFGLCIRLIVALTLVLGLVISHLILKQRERELALQQLLGLPKGSIFAASFAEMFALSLIGAVAGAAAVWLVSGTPPPWLMLGLFIAANFIGEAVAIGAFLRKDLIKAIKGAE
ncbi:MAG: hypothetical protein Q4C04_04845 [Clostridia bacterium]|nr:hypothetical protein [Clostridia bacterium]